MSPERTKHANFAIESAIATLKTVLDDPDMQRALVGVPLYLHSMITFAAVFLLKIAAKGCSNGIPGSQGQHNSIASAGLLIDNSHVRDLVGHTVDLMVACSERASKHHLSHHIARGLRKMLAGFEEWERRYASARRPGGQISQDADSAFEPIIIPGSNQLDAQGSVWNHTAPLLGVARLSAERSNGFVPGRPGLSEGSLDPMMADCWGFDEEYFPMGVFDFLQSQMPA